MADRVIVYAGQLAQSTDFLLDSRDSLYGMSRMMEHVLRGQTDPAENSATPPVPLQLFSGLTPSVPGADLNVHFDYGGVYGLLPVDATGMGGLGADPRLVYQQGLIDSFIVNFPATAPAGQVTVYLVQGKLDIVEPMSVVPLLYYNSANPLMPLNGQGGDGLNQPISRNPTITISRKTGPTGASPVCPAPDAGYVGLYAVFVPNGATVLHVTGGSKNVFVVDQVVSPQPNPFIAGLNSQHHLGLPGSAPKIDLGSEVQGVLPLVNGGFGGRFLTTTLLDAQAAPIPVGGVEAPPLGYFAYPAAVDQRSDIDYVLTRGLAIVETGRIRLTNAADGSFVNCTVYDKIQSAPSGVTFTGAFNAGPNAIQLLYTTTPTGTPVAATFIATGMSAT